MGDEDNGEEEEESKVNASHFRLWFPKTRPYSPYIDRRRVGGWLHEWGHPARLMRVIHKLKRASEVLCTWMENTAERSRLFSVYVILWFY